MVQNPIPAQPRATIAPARVVTVEDFLRHKPVEFTGGATLNEADAWLHKCKKIFGVMNFADEQKRAFAVYLLNNDVEYWWAGMQQQMQTREKPVTCAE